MEEQEFLARLRDAGYDAYVDDVVMVRIDPCVQNTDDLRKFVRSCEWQRSWGMEMTRPDPLRKDSEPPSRTVQKTNARKVQRKAPPVDPAPAAGVIPGQMNIFDFLKA